MIMMAPQRTTTTDANPGRPTVVEVAAHNGRARITTLEHGDYVAVRPLRVRGRHVRVALVGIRMALLAGDCLDLQVHVGRGVALEVVEPTGMVAYDSSSEAATWHLYAHVEPGAALIWHGSSFVAAEGSDASRVTTLDLESGACAVVHETLVLGRSGEQRAVLYSHMNVRNGGHELLVEELAVNEHTRELPGIVHPAKAMSSVVAAGWRPAPQPDDPHRFDLAGNGALFRALGSAAHHAHDVVTPVFADWREQLLKQSRLQG